jgi:DNA-binding CsgD family transcriptional regulator
VEWSGVDLTPLSKREMQVVRLISDGKGRQDIAKLLGISQWTVDAHRRHVFMKLRVNSIALLVRWYLAQLAMKAR